MVHIILNSEEKQRLSVSRSNPKGGWWYETVSQAAGSGVELECEVIKVRVRLGRALGITLNSLDFVLYMLKFSRVLVPL